MQICAVSQIFHVFPSRGEVCLTGMWCMIQWWAPLPFRVTSVLGRRDGWVAGRIDGWMDGWIDDEKYVSVGGCAGYVRALCAVMWCLTYQSILCSASWSLHGVFWCLCVSVCMCWTHFNLSWIILWYMSFRSREGVRGYLAQKADTGFPRILKVLNCFESSFQRL